MQKPALKFLLIIFLTFSFLGLSTQNVNAQAGWLHGLQEDGSFPSCSAESNCPPKPNPDTCNNGPNANDSGGCGTACGAGKAWSKYQLECKKVSLPGDREECEWKWVLGPKICSTGDKCDAQAQSSGGLKAGACNCSVGGLYKLCCATGTSASACVKGGIQDTSPPDEGVCPSGTTSKFCGFGSYPPCSDVAAVCGGVTPPPPNGQPPPPPNNLCNDGTGYCAGPNQCVSPCTHLGFNFSDCPADVGCCSCGPPPPPICNPTLPDKPQLTAPANGATQVQNPVTLDWEALGIGQDYWGKSCGQGDDEYRVYAHTNPDRVVNSRDVALVCTVARVKDDDRRAGVPQPSSCTVSLSTGRKYYWKVRAHNGGGSNTDSDIWEFTTSQPPGWWQVKDADVQTNSDLNSTIPTAGTYFDLKGAGGFPGIPATGGSEATFGSGSVSETGWVAKNSPYQGRRYDYQWFKSLVPAKAFDCDDSEVGCLAAGSTIVGGTLISGYQSGGYIWRYAQGDLTFHGTASLGPRRMVLIVNGNFNIGDANNKANISLNDGTGFFAVIVKGDIVISPKVEEGGGANPSLEGIFFADGIIFTGSEADPTADKQLRIRGVLASWLGINLQRDLDPTGTTGANGTTPAEIIEFAPDLIFTFPRELAARRGLVWREIAP